jgi:glycosyltransferase involved in cell wall biosynthesis
MRILHISTRLILGGSQENTLLSCEGQARLGHEVHLAFGPIYGPEGSLLARVEAFNARCAEGTERVRAVGSAPCIRPAGEAVYPITTHVLPRMLREVHPYYDHMCFHNELRPLMKRLAPGVVHTHSSKAGVLGRWAAWKELRNSAAIIHTIHGPPFMPVPTAGEAGSLGRAKVRLSNFAYTLAERFAAARCHKIVSVADAMTTEFLSRGIAAPALYTTVRSGMETAPFLNAAPGETRDAVRAVLGFSSDDFVIGTVARLAQHKGHDDLLDALGTALREDPRLKLLWVGDGWLKQGLLARARGMGLVVRDAREKPRDDAKPDAAAQIIVTGLLPPEHIPSMMRAMDVLAHPSYREGLPRTVPQALLCAVPVVAYDCDGTREACIDVMKEAERGTGRLVAVGDRARLRDAVLWMRANPEARAAMGARGRAMCAEMFDAEVMVARLEEVYRNARAG